MNNIHRNARIGRNVQVGAFTTIEEDVVIGDGCIIGANVNILNGTRMGSHCRVFPGAVVGAVPQEGRRPRAHVLGAEVALDLEQPRHHRRAPGGVRVPAAHQPRHKRWPVRTM